MTSYVRLTVKTCIAAALVGGASLSGIPLTAMSDVRNICEYEAQRAESLEQQMNEMLHRHEVKMTVIADLIERRMTMGEALARFRQLYQHEPPDTRERVRKVLGASSDEELNRCRVLTLLEITRQERANARLRPASRGHLPRRDSAG